MDALTLPPAPYTFPKRGDLIVAMARAPDPHARLGSKDFRFIADNGHEATTAACPKSADFVGEVG